MNEPSSVRSAATTASVGSLRSTVVKLLRDPTLRMLLLLTLVGAAATLWYLTRLSGIVVESTVLEGTRLYADAIEEFRSLYTSEVVNRVLPRGVPVTHDYLEHPGAIPLPATFSIALGERIGSHGTGLHVKLYSEYPFPWRRNRPPLDKFETEAIEFLRHNPEQSFYKVEDYAGRKSLRYARADRMRPACIACHNTHPDSPRRDWKPGDVRGVLEIVRPLDAVTAMAGRVWWGVSGFAGVIGLLAMLGFALTIDRLRQVAVELEIKVRQRTEELATANSELEQARDVAESASRMKSEFLGTVSHELRTPLSAIIGFTDLLSDEAMGPVSSEQKAALTHIAGNGARLLTLINDILDFSTVEVDAKQLVPEPIDPVEFTRHCVDSIRESAASKGIQLDETFEPGLGPALLDGNVLKQVLFNLLSNALKFSADRGRVSVAVRKLSAAALTQKIAAAADPRRPHRILAPAANDAIMDFLEIAVADTGIGIAEADMNKLFAAFIQMDSGSTREHQGAGLGLALTRRLVERHGGGMLVESRLGHGSCFTIWIPWNPRGPGEN